MAKKFYTLEEAAAKLGKSEDQVREMASSGQLSEFRDRDRLMFKVDQIDLLSGGHDDMIKLAESGEHESFNLAASGSASGMNVNDAKEASAISLADSDMTEDADPSAVTRITASPVQMQDPGKSGSGTGGLLDLTKEADDTSLGAGLLDDVYGGETVAQQTTADSPGASGEGAGVGADAGGLFETSGTETAEAAAVPMMMMGEPLDGLWSGISGGLAAGMILALGLGLFTVVSGLTGAAGGGMMKMMGDNFYAFAGGALGVVVVGAIVGMMAGKRG